METSKNLQEKLILKARSHHPVSMEVEQAFYHRPRHKFIPPDYSLAEAYRDAPLYLYHQGIHQSTISQPSFVIYLLELLKLKRGQKVFEVGTGSGWNAALMGYLVGERGKVVSMEIVPELAKRARETLKKLEIKNVEVITGDASNGWEKEAPYDRMIFTAAAQRRPPFMLQQLVEGGRVLFVQAGSFGVDEVQVLEKDDGRFMNVLKLPCHFVAMTGSTTGEPSRWLS